MNEVELLMSDEFVDFSKKIAVLHETKKAQEKELKKVYEEYKAAFKKIDAQAAELQKEFDAWKASQTRGSGQDKKEGA